MAPVSAENANPDHVAFILSALSHVEDIKIDWNGVAAANGIGYARNAASKFKDTVKKYGYKFEGSKMIRLSDEDGDANTNAVPKTPSKRSKKNGGGKAGRPAKKQKIEQLPEDDDDAEKAVEKQAVKVEEAQVMDGSDEGEQD